MAIKEYVLVVDDNDQQPTIDNIISSLDNPKIEFLNCYISKQFRNTETDLSLNISEIEKRILEIIDGKPLALVLTDYSFEAPNYNGLDVVKLIRKKRQNSNIPIALYSADRKAIIQNVIGKNRDFSIDDIAEAVNTLMGYEISYFWTRGEYEAQTSYVLKRIKNIINPIKTLTQFLWGNSNKTFKSCFPPLQGKTFGEIADILEDKDNGNSQKFYNAIMEQTLAYLLEVNE